MPEFKEGDLVLCKKDYYITKDYSYEKIKKDRHEFLLFEKDKTYIINDFWGDEEYEILHLNNSEMGQTFYHIDKKDIDMFEEDEITNHFDDFFYTKKEMRKLKINKIDGKT